MTATADRNDTEAGSRIGKTGRTGSVVHVITALSTGGAERQLQWLVEHSGYRSSTVALYDSGIVGDAMVASGHPVSVLGMSGPGRLTATLRLARLLRRLRPDVVHVHLLAAQLWGIPAARLARVPVVVSSEHSLMDTSLENRPLTRSLRLIYRGLERMSTHTLAVSTITRDRLLRVGVNAPRITVVDNGIDFAALTFDPAARQSVRREWGIADGVVVIGAVGRLETVKRLEPMVTELAPELIRRGHHLVIAGDGPLRARLAELAVSLGVADRVHLLGPRADMRSVLAGFDVMISLSRDETFGMAVVEALGNGLPVVYESCPALTEMSDVPAWAVQVPAASTVGADDSVDGDARETSGLLAAIEQARSAPGRNPDGRFPVPSVLTSAFGIGHTAAAVDGLYDRLLTARSPRRHRQRRS